MRFTLLGITCQRSFRLIHTWVKLAAYIALKADSCVKVLTSYAFC